MCKTWNWRTAGTCPACDAANQQYRATARRYAATHSTSALRDVIAAHKVMARAYSALALAHDPYP